MQREEATPGQHSRQRSSQTGPIGKHPMNGNRNRVKVTVNQTTAGGITSTGAGDITTGQDPDRERSRLKLWGMVGAFVVGVATIVGVVWQVVSG